MNTTQATNSLIKISNENSALESNSLIALYEIDVTEIATTESLAKAFRSINFNYNENQDLSKIFRFHNNLKLINKNIVFNGKTFVALPIDISGFEISSKGLLPVPKLSIISSSEGDLFFSTFKMFIRYLNGLVGAKVTRIRTFLKYIDGINFYANWNGDCAGQNSLTLNDSTVTPPRDFCPDPNAIFPKDVYYVDRKSIESKGGIELELASLIDVQGALLPARMVMEKKCSWQYRGEGCCYEYSTNRITATHGSATLPTLANPKANEKDEKISDAISDYKPNQVNVPGDWQYGSTYAAGAIVKIKIDNINYYFVSKGATPVNSPPPNDKYWIADQCSKSLKGCKLRWAGNSDFSGFLPFGGFPGIQPRG